MVVAAIAANLLQTGFIFSFYPLKPDIKKIDPIKGFKKIFSMKALFELVKSGFKFITTLAIIGWFFYDHLASLLFLQEMQLWAGLKSTLFLLFKLLSWLLITLFIFAAIDWFFSKRQYIRNLKMTKQDVKDEYKRREGDPLIKQKRREILTQLLKKTQGLGNISKADMVVTNPTHFAVALHYECKVMAAPEVLCKGADEVALFIRREAVKHQIPIIEKPSLARLLFYNSDSGKPIPEQSFFDVALLLYRLKRQNIQICS